MDKYPYMVKNTFNFIVGHKKLTRTRFEVIEYVFFLGNIMFIYQKNQKKTIR